MCESPIDTIKRLLSSEAIKKNRADDEDDSDADLLEAVRDISESDLSEELDEIRPFIPQLLIHPSWVLRVETLELIGDNGLHEYADLVVDCLHDDHSVVRSYSVFILYDIYTSKVLRLISEKFNDDAPRVRIEALTIKYLITHDVEILDEILHTFQDENCIEDDKVACFNQFQSYDLDQLPNVRQFIRKYYSTLDRNTVLSNKLAKLIASWDEKQ